MKLFPVLCVLLLIPYSQVFSEDDTECLKDFKNSVTDPKNYLANWIFGNAPEPEGYICSFNGVLCWNAVENRVLGLNFSSAGLSGQFPFGLSKCNSLQALDFSQNNFDGFIPDDICKQIQYMTALDLSQNSFSGPIPTNLGDCQYLNILHLQHNQLSGELPWDIGILPRLSDLNVSYNSLSGPIPSSYSNRTSLGPPFPASAFENNPSLCGPPLSKSC